MSKEETIRLVRLAKQFRRHRLSVFSFIRYNNQLADDSGRAIRITITRELAGIYYKKT